MFSLSLYISLSIYIYIYIYAHLSTVLSLSLSVSPRTLHTLFAALQGPSRRIERPINGAAAWPEQDTA